MKRGAKPNCPPDAREDLQLRRLQDDAAVGFFSNPGHRQRPVAADFLLNHQVRDQISIQTHPHVLQCCHRQIDRGRLTFAVARTSAEHGSVADFRVVWAGLSLAWRNGVEVCVQQQTSAVTAL